MNYTDVFNKYSDQGWSNNAKLELLLRFLDLNSRIIVTPNLFDQYIKEIVEIENSNSEE